MKVLLPPGLSLFTPLDVESGSPMTRHRALMPGESAYGVGRVRLSTILGSCVSIAVWHPLRKAGGMCHIVLPGDRGTPDGRYAGGAAACLRLAMAYLAVPLAECVARLYGGSALYADETMPPSLRVGARNVDAAREVARRFGMPIMSEDVGGRFSRHLSMSLETGEVACCRTPVNCEREVEC